jgi:hypothetical protein
LSLDVLKLLAGTEEEFSRGLVQLGWYNYPPTMSDARYSGRAGMELEPKLRAAGEVLMTRAIVYRLTLNSDRWHDAKAVVESHLRREPHFAAVFCRLSNALLVFVPSNPDQAFRRAEAGIAVDMVFLDLKYPSNFETEVIKKLQDAPGQQFRSRLQEIVDTERVTRDFYNQFDSELNKFQPLITGIGDADRSWYSSVILNRLMFIYFLQRRGFLDGNRDYLRDRLLKVQQHRGKDRFQSFYRFFLLRLFHEGLGSRKRTRDPVFAELLGKVPFLNGGLFEVHDIEERHAGEDGTTTIDIPDKAFEEVFAFLSGWEWCLDTRPGRTTNEINPDVLGYIFEKYINQKQMGAYYTKEDITGYIGRSTIVPRLLDRTRELCRDKAALECIWDILKADPDSYIFEPVRRGVIDAAGNVIPAHDKRYNRGDAELLDEDGNKLTLPTETWREHVARRQRCLELRDKLVKGEVQDVDDLITYNLDIRQFALDIIAQANAPLLRAFWDSMMGYEGQVGVHKNPVPALSVLDPTCGSGAFLFAALNILDPLYRACIARMQKLVAEATAAQSKKGHLVYFQSILALVDDAARHPNPDYFILKSIVVRNLYGVDVMDEAVEICRLRLFLKLVACVYPDTNKPNQGLEPLPDIDFNIRTGNTLVGYVRQSEIDNAIAGGLFQQDKKDRLRRQLGEAIEKADVCQRQYRVQQLGPGGEVTAVDRKQVAVCIKKVKNLLSPFMASDYEVDPGDASAYDKWLESHKPFHWLTEFHDIMGQGGFDVIIGNPPYIASSKVRKHYDVKRFTTHDCTDIYAWVLERSHALLSDSGRSGMIAPLSMGFSSDFDSLRRFLFAGYGANWFSSYGRIPSALFSFDVRVRNTIHIGAKSKQSPRTFTTRLHRWFEVARPALFHTIEYARYEPAAWNYRIPKLNTTRLVRAFEHLAESKRTLQAVVSPRSTRHVLHFKKTAYNWLNFCREMPPCYEGDRRVAHTKFGEIYFPDADTLRLALLLANGKLMLVFWFAVADDFDVTRWNFGEFPTDLSSLSAAQRAKLLSSVPELEEAMAAAVQFKLNAGRRVGNFNLAKCRTVTDKSDAILAEALGLSDAWEDIELYYAQTVRTDFGDELNQE